MWRTILRSLQDHIVSLKSNCFSFSLSLSVLFRVQSTLNCFDLWNWIHNNQLPFSKSLSNTNDPHTQTHWHKRSILTVFAICSVVRPCSEFYRYHIAAWQQMSDYQVYRRKMVNWKDLKYPLALQICIFVRIAIADIVVRFRVFSVADDWLFRFTSRRSRTHTLFTGGRCLRPAVTYHHFIYNLNRIEL